MNAYVARVQSVLQAGRARQRRPALLAVRRYGRRSARAHAPVRRAREQMAHRVAGRPAGQRTAGGRLCVRLHLRRAARAAARARWRSSWRPGGRYARHRGSAPRAACPSRDAAQTLRDCDEAARRGVRSCPQDVPGYGRLEARRASSRSCSRNRRCGRGRRADIEARSLELGVRARAAPAAGLALHPPRARRRLRLFPRQSRRQGTSTAGCSSATPASLRVLLDPLTGAQARRPLRTGTRGWRRSICSSPAASRWSCARRDASEARGSSPGATRSRWRRAAGRR